MEQSGELHLGLTKGKIDQIMYEIRRSEREVNGRTVGTW